MEEYGTKTFGELNAERYDAMYEELMGAETADSVETLAELAAGGKVLELAIGTGRVALPLAARGLTVHGIEASEAMVAMLRRKPGGSTIPVAIGNMAEVRLNDTFDLIYLVFNTIFNLTTQEAQVRCFHNAARHLNAAGLFVVETVVPDLSGYVDGQRMKGSWARMDSARFEIAIHDPVLQTVAVSTHRDQRRRDADDAAFHALCLALRTRPHGPIGRSRAPRTMGVVGPLSIHRRQQEPCDGVRPRGAVVFAYLPPNTVLQRTLCALRCMIQVRFLI